MATDPKNLVGTTLAGRYRIEKPVGEGGMGAIFAATQLSLGRAVAIKVVKSVHADDSEAIKRFERETEVIARLAHPNVVQVVDAGRADDGTMFLAMELLDGETVRALLKKLGALPVPRALAIVDDVASALAAAHAGGVIHRDLKAENVMLVKAGKHEVAKVLDFGVAKLTAKTEAPPQTGSGFVAGTPGCIAPEQMLGKSDDPRSDLYSVGVLLFEMLAGEAPFSAATSVELMMKHLTEPPPRVADVARARGRPEVPAAVDELVAALLSKDPDGRPASADALGDIVASMRDASRSTQPDLRLPTPQGGFAVPTPGSVVLAPASSGVGPRAPEGTPAAPLASNAAVASVATVATVATASTPMPVPTAPAQQLLRGRPPYPSFAKVAPRFAALALVICALGYGGLRGLEWWSDRAIPGWSKDVGEAWDRFSPLDEAFLDLDIAKVRENASWIVERGHEAPLAHIYLAHAAMLERAPLTVIDHHLATARAMAERRSSRVAGRTHTALLVDALAEIDPVEAERKWQRHVEFSGCGPWHDAEAHLWAQKLTFTENDGARMLAVYTSIQKNVDDMEPLTRLGYARALKHLRRLDEAAAVLTKMLERDPSNPIIVEALVDVELAQGKREQALQRLDALLQKKDHRRLTLRRANIRVVDDPAAHDVMLAYLATRPDGAEKAQSLAAMGYALAARGRFVEADTLWQRAMAAAGGDDTVIAELAVFASMFGAVAGDAPLAKQWLAVYHERSLGLTDDSASARRMKAFALGNRIMLAMYEGKMTDAPVQKDYARLQQHRIDVPFFADTIAWYVTLQTGRLDEAIAMAETQPLCFSDLHAGVALMIKGDLAAAAARLEEATTPEMEAFCTSGDDIVPYVQTLSFAKALAWRADVALKRGDREDAALALQRFHGLWSRATLASGPGVPLPEWRQALARIEDALGRR